MQLAVAPVSRSRELVQQDELELERTSEFLLSEVKRRHGARFRQGARKPPLFCGVESPVVKQVILERLRGVCDAAMRGLSVWSSGFPVLLFDFAPAPLEILAIQARGARCVSRLPEGARTLPHAGRLEFLLHDLCHLAKFSDPRFFAEQVGFFARFERALWTPDWAGLERDLDDGWIADRDHVLADMNGSSVFLFAALKMRLKMAARRTLARKSGHLAPMTGPLSSEELELFDGLLGRMLDAVGFEGALRRAAIATSTRRDCPIQAALIADAFQLTGSAVLEGHDDDPGRVQRAALNSR